MSEFEKFKKICEKYEIRENERDNCLLDNALLNLIGGLDYDDAYNVINEIWKETKKLKNEKYDLMINRFWDLFYDCDFSSSDDIYGNW